MTVLFFVVALVSVVVLLVHVAEIYHARWYVPLQLKSAALDRWLALAAMVHLWSTLVSYDTEPEFHAARVAHCALWSYWLQLFAGLQPWVLLLLFRVLQHGRDYHPRIRHWSRARYTGVRVGACVASAVPLFATCALVTAEVGADGRCHTTDPAWKVAVVLWSAAMLVTLAGTGAEVYRRATAVTRSGRALRDCVLVALCILVAASAVHAAGVADAGYAIVPLVAALHLFVLLRCFGYTVWKAVRHDHAYAHSFFTKPGESAFIEHRSLHTADCDRAVMGDFLNFATMMGRLDLVSLYNDVRAVVVARREARDASDAWDALKDGHTNALSAVLGTNVGDIDLLPPEHLYGHVVAHMQHELGRAYFAQATPNLAPGTILDSSSESRSASSSSSTGEIVYAELARFDEGGGSSSDSGSTDAVTYASIRDFVDG